MKTLFTVALSIAFISTAAFANEDDILLQHAAKKADALIEKFGQHLRDGFDYWCDATEIMNNQEIHEMDLVHEIVLARIGLAQAELRVLKAWLKNDTDLAMSETIYLLNYLAQIENTYPSATTPTAVKGLFWFIMSQGDPHSSEGHEAEKREIASFIGRRYYQDQLLLNVTRRLLSDYQAPSLDSTSPTREIGLSEGVGRPPSPDIDLRDITEENIRATTVDDIDEILRNQNL